jgi:hypothetical protein
MLESVAGGGTDEAVVGEVVYTEEGSDGGVTGEGVTRKGVTEGATVYMQRRRGRATGKRSFHTKHHHA